MIKTLNQIRNFIESWSVLTALIPYDLNIPKFTSISKSTYLNSTLLMEIVLLPFKKAEENSKPLQEEEISKR